MKKVVCLGLLLALSACSNMTREKLGLVKETPNEYLVVSRPALTLPPDYALTPVNANMSKEQDVHEYKKDESLSSGEKALLGKVYEGDKKVEPVAVVKTEPKVENQKQNVKPLIKLENKEAGYKEFDINSADDSIEKQEVVAEDEAEVVITDEVIEEASTGEMVYVNGQNE